MPVVMGENSCALTLVPEKTPPTCVGVKVIFGEPIQTNESEIEKLGFGLFKTVKFWLEESTQNAFETLYFIEKTPTVLGVKTVPETLVPENIPPLALGVNMALASFKQKVVFVAKNKGSGLAFTSIFLLKESTQVPLLILYFKLNIPTVSGVNLFDTTLIPENTPPA
jgi:hypothetical protein